MLYFIPYILLFHYYKWLLTFIKKLYSYQNIYHRTKDIHYSITTNYNRLKIKDTPKILDDIIQRFKNKRIRISIIDNSNPSINITKVIDGDDYHIYKKNTTYFTKNTRIFIQV